MADQGERIEWPTLLLLAACYALWTLSLFWLAAFGLPLAILSAALTIALHSSLQHEAIHGHPFRNQALNSALVRPALGLVVPYGRFRDGHLAHHRDARLTDPFDDPESNYLDPSTWERLPGPLRGLLRANNTLLGRILLGPMIGTAVFWANDIAEILRGNRTVCRSWCAHLPAVAVVVTVVWIAPMPVWAYALAAYLGLSILKIRTFLEHRAHEHCGARSVIVEDRGPLALLFLNNNLHVVHHMHPRVPWYRLPRLYAQNAERYRRRNQGYVYRSYVEVFAQHFLRSKDPVPHPLWRRESAPIGRRHGAP